MTHKIKLKTGFTLLEILVVTAVIGLLAAMTIPKVKAGQAQWDIGSFTLPTAISSPATNAYSTNTTVSSYTITPGVPITLTVQASSTGSEAGSLTNKFNLYDGQRWTTTGPLQVITPLAGTNLVCCSSNFPAGAFTGYQQIRPDIVATPNDTNQSAIAAIDYSSFH